MQDGSRVLCGLLGSALLPGVPCHWGITTGKWGRCLLLGIKLTDYDVVKNVCLVLLPKALWPAYSCDLHLSLGAPSSGWCLWSPVQKQAPVTYLHAILCVCWLVLTIIVPQLSVGYCLLCVSPWSRMCHEGRHRVPSVCCCIPRAWHIAGAQRALDK